MFDLKAWLAVVGVVLALFALDLYLAVRRPHAVGLGEAAVWSACYIAVAIGFGLVLWPLAGGHLAAEYLAGWLVEKSLSVDNLFVFVIIMGRFAVPPAHQQKALLFGIAVALALRSVLIAVGAAAVSAFSFTFLLFGLLLIWTAIQLLRHHDKDPDINDNPVLKALRRLVPVTDGFQGGRLTVREGGRRLITPLFLVFAAIGGTDLLFALDSIPAIFGITREPLPVFAANAFALPGLRALYLLIEGPLGRLVYLPLILAFICVKLIMLFLHEDVSPVVPEIPSA